MDEFGGLSTEQLLALYRRMLLIRNFEDRVYYLFLQGEIPGTLHQYQGQEAVAVGVCDHLSHTDWITSTHRPHGHALAKGVSTRAAMAELYGKATGCCGGKGGSMHLGDPSVGMLPAIAIVGGGNSVVAGLGLAFKLRKSPAGRGLLLRRGRDQRGRLPREPELRGRAEAADPLRLREQPLRRLDALYHDSRVSPTWPSAPAPMASPRRSSTAWMCWRCTRRPARRWSRFARAMARPDRVQDLSLHRATAAATRAAIARRKRKRSGRAATRSRAWATRWSPPARRMRRRWKPSRRMSRPS